MRGLPPKAFDARTLRVIVEPDKAARISFNRIGGCIESEERKFRARRQEILQTDIGLNAVPVQGPHWRRRSPPNHYNQVSSP